MRKIIVIFGKNRKFADILVVIAYIFILLVIAFLLWKLLSPVIAIAVSLIIAYLIDLRKFVNKR